MFKKLLVLSLLFLCACSKGIYNERIVIPKEEPLVIPKDKSLKLNVEKPVLSTPAKSNLLVGIDAGHGGKDEGAESKFSPKYLEKHLTLATAKILERYLREFGYRTILIRKDDTFIDLKDRAKFANEKKCDYFISVHYNAAENTKAHGIEVYYYKTEKDGKRSSESKQLASIVLENVINHTKGKSRGIKHGNFAVIRETKMPAILVEGGFITNKEEMDKIRKVEYMKELALGIAQGFKKFLAKQNVN